MNLTRHKEGWEDLAELDPLFAILFDPQKQFGKWDVKDFFLTGEQEIGKLMKSCIELGYPRTREVALDFGCGVGRLTRALAPYFASCCGVDIAEPMIAKAKELNKSVRNCNFIVNTRDDLRIFPDDHFDMVYTYIVLQHLPGVSVVKAYLSEFVRTLRKNGLLVFQLPNYLPLRRRLQPRRRAYSLLRALGFSKEFLYVKLRLFPPRMIYMPENDVTTFLESTGAEVLQVRTDYNSTALTDNSVYYVTK